MECLNVLKFISSYHEALNDRYDYVINMDDTPIHINPQLNRTIELEGSRTVDVPVVNTGHTKLRMTLVLSISSACDLFTSFGLPLAYNVYSLYMEKEKSKTIIYWGQPSGHSNPLQNKPNLKFTDIY